MKTLLFLSSLLSACLSVQAQQPASTLYLSHCDGELAAYGVKGTSGKQWNSAATLFTSADVAPMVGNDLTAVRVGLASKLNVEELCLWVRSSLDGENLASASTSDITKGWIELPLTVPYHIADASDLYLGISYRQKGSSKCVGVLDGSYVEGGFYFQAGDADWTDYSALGVACIEGCVTGESLPQYDLALTSVSVPKNHVLGTELPVGLTISNRAAATVTGFTARITVADSDPIDVHLDCQLPYRESGSFTAVVSPRPSAQQIGADVHVEIVEIDGGDDICPANNAQQTTVNLLSREYERHMLIEEFTTERCTNCPAAANMLHQLLDDPAYSDRISAVCHHAGFGTDWLTTDNASQYLWFYVSSQTYAPGFMWDRCLLSGQSAPVTSCPTSITDMRQIVDQRLSATALCEVNASASYDATARKLSVNVWGERCAVFSTAPARVTVFVVENNIEAQAQTGATSTPYYHQHALRGYNATFGSEIEWQTDETFQYTCQIEVRPDWNIAELSIIAFVSSYDSDSQANCAVENSCEISFPGTEAITLLTTDRQPTVSYNLSGQRISNPKPGQLHITSDGIRYMK